VSINRERFEELQKHGETRWSQDGYIIIDDTITEKAGDEVSGAWDSMKLLGALTDQGETTFFECESNFTVKLRFTCYRHCSKSSARKLRSYCIMLRTSRRTP
jgi:hypothetical protein